MAAPRRNEVDWIQQGCQRRAVVQALYKPLSGREILEIARTWAPEIQLRDVWFVLRQLGEKEVVRCLTPELATGNLYCLTARGSALKASAFGTPAPALPTGIDWVRYAFVVRARVRRLVLAEISSPGRNGKEGKSASTIRKCLVERQHPVAMPSVLRALADLRRLELTRSFPCPDDARSKFYVLTPMGRRIDAQLQR